MDSLKNSYYLVNPCSPSYNEYYMKRFYEHANANIPYETMGSTNVYLSHWATFKNMKPSVAEDEEKWAPFCIVGNAAN